MHPASLYPRRNRVAPFREAVANPSPVSPHRLLHLTLPQRTCPKGALDHQSHPRPRQHQTLPVVAMIASVEPGIRERCPEASMTDHLVTAGPAPAAGRNPPRPDGGRLRRLSPDCGARVVDVQSPVPVVLAAQRILDLPVQRPS